MEPVAWRSNGEMDVNIEGEQYTYFGLTRDLYYTVIRMCKTRTIGQMIQFLKPFARPDRTPMLKGEKV